MTRSDWGDWLPRAVADADPETVALWYLGCNGFAIKGSAGTTLWIDPYLGVGRPPRTVRMIPVPFDPEDVTTADAVLATHEHIDHVHGPSQGPILANTGASFVGPDDSVDKARREGWTEEWDIAEAQLETVREGTTIEIGEFTVDVVPTHDPDATHPVGYLIDHESGTVFHGGDTKPADSFADLGRRRDIDLGILALGSTGMIKNADTGEPELTKWYGGPDEVIQAAADLRLDRLLPSHWDMWKGVGTDPTVLHHHGRSFDYPERLEIVEIGDRIDL